MTGTIHCPICSQVFQLQDKVILDEFYTVIHKQCYLSLTSVKEVGTYKEIIDKNKVLK